MLPDRVSNPGPLTYESDALPIALRGPASLVVEFSILYCLDLTFYRKFSFCFFVVKELIMIDISN